MLLSTISVLPTSNPFVGVKICKSEGQPIIVEKRFNRMYAYELFAREVSLCTIIPNHPGLCRMIDYFCDCGAVILYEYAPGGDLFEAVHRKSRSNPIELIRWLACILCDVLEAVACIHDHGILHRDLKLENVLLTESGKAILCDFSFCEWIDNDNDGKDTTTLCVSSGMHINPKNALAKITTELVGTEGCLSPELLESNIATVKTDMFAIGVLMYELTTMHKAYPQNRMCQPNKLKFPSWTPFELRTIILNLLDFNPNNRPTCKELLANEWLCAFNSARA